MLTATSEPWLVIKRRSRHVNKPRVRPHDYCGFENLRTKRWETQTEPGPGPEWTWTALRVGASTAIAVVVKGGWSERGLGTGTRHAGSARRGHHKAKLTFCTHFHSVWHLRGAGRGSAFKCPVGTEKGGGGRLTWSRGCGRRLHNSPLQDAGVFPAAGDQATVIVQEGHVGHMTAVTAVLQTRSLQGSGGGRKSRETPQNNQAGSILDSCLLFFVFFFLCHWKFPSLNP